MSFDLALTPAHHDLIERTHAFARDVIRPVADRYDRDEAFPWPVLEQAAREGFYNPLFYRDLIGDPTGLSLPVFMEELFWGCAGIGLSIVMPALALSAMAQAATSEQLLRWAPECFGEPGDIKLAALCVSEPEGGSDVRNLRTRARSEGDEWVIDGHKIWIGNGGIANVHVVNATVDPELGHRGQALFVMPGGTPGLERAQRRAGNRHRALPRLVVVRVVAPPMGESAVDQRDDDLEVLVILILLKAALDDHSAGTAYAVSGRSVLPAGDPTPATPGVQSQLRSLISELDGAKPGAGGHCPQTR